MKKIIAKYIAAGSAFFIPFTVFAQSGIDAGLDKIGDVFPHQGLTAQRTLSELILYIINIMLFFAGMIAVMFIIVGGYWYITSAGNEEQAEKGKTTLVNAIMGIILVILSWVIIRVVTNLVGNDHI